MELMESLSKMVLENLNGKNLTPLTEATLDRCLDYHGDHGFVILSANRTDSTPADNYIATGKMLADMKALGLSYFTVYGGYQENTGKFANYETSFFVPAKDRNGTPIDMDTLVAEAMNLGAKYNQDSILVKRPGEYPCWVGTRPGDNFGSITNVFDEPTEKNDASQPFFTSLIKAKYANLHLDEPKRLKRFTYMGEKTPDELPGDPMCPKAPPMVSPPPASEEERRRREANGELII